MTEKKADSNMPGIWDSYVITHHWKSGRIYQAPIYGFEALARIISNDYDDCSTKEKPPTAEELKKLWAEKVNETELQDSMDFDYPDETSYSHITIFKLDGHGLQEFIQSVMFSK